MPSIQLLNQINKIREVGFRNPSSIITTNPFFGCGTQGISLPTNKFYKKSTFACTRRHFALYCSMGNFHPKYRVISALGKPYVVSQSIFEKASSQSLCPTLFTSKSQKTNVTCFQLFSFSSQGVSLCFDLSRSLVNILTSESCILYVRL